MMLRSRYSNMYIPSDFFSSAFLWVDVFPAHRPFVLGHSCDFHIMQKTIEPLIKAEPVAEPSDADYRFSAKVTGFLWYDFAQRNNRLHVRHWLVCSKNSMEFLLLLGNMLYSYELLSSVVRQRVVQQWTVVVRCCWVMCCTTVECSCQVLSCHVLLSLYNSADCCQWTTTNVWWLINVLNHIVIWIYIAPTSVKAKENVAAHDWKCCVICPKINRQLIKG